MIRLLWPPPWAKVAAAIFPPIKIPAVSYCFLLLLWSRRGLAFSLPTATAAAARGKNNSNNNNDGPDFFQHVLVEHTDQLQQRRYHEHHDDGGSAGDQPTPLVPPPHLFCIPAPGGDICLVVDEQGGYHAVRDVCPPLGVPVSQTGVVDSQVGAIGDSLLGTRFHLNDGTVRGPWCPGGGTAGPLLLRLARHRRYARLARLLVDPPRRMSWMAQRLSSSLSRQRKRERVETPLLRRPLKFGESNAATAATGLEVFAVTKQPDGSLTVVLPRLPQPLRTATGKCKAGDGGLAATAAATAVVQAKRNLAGYDY
ncbi:unnamed protein product [Pylaiella littoralis]